MTHTSRMVVVTTPRRFGFEIVDVFFGQVRVRMNQAMAVQGDLLRNLETGEVCVFEAREGTTIITQEMN